MRLYAYDVPDSDKDVSIHASVKDATRRNALLRSSKSGFNPRICKRCDTPNGDSELPLTSFNPRICKRCDTFAPKHKTKKNVSIHASVKDATYFAVRQASQFWFQSTHL